MGIKGIYKEIGAGKRISLCKLAVESLETRGRPLRLAIDIAIWQFQVQAARGGANPAIRTLFYRLVRLLGLGIEPIFVFDGPNKPVFKRNKRSGRGDGVATAMAKRLIRLFGFDMHDAPGEAEAECALLQQQGIVDAVLSEDVDTLMFGCTQTLRNWSADGSKTSKTPTHVSVYNTADLAQSVTGLDREGMVLVALMSGGDYIPEGVPGCGVKVACEAARAGFGKTICRIKKANAEALAAWRDSLLHELRTNEGGFFRTRHKALQIPDSFPDMDVLRYYTHPVVSPPATVDRLKADFPSARAVDVSGLREFVSETFDWTCRIGAVKFIRVLGPSLLVQKMLALSSRDYNAKSIPAAASTLVNGITTRRSHFSTDATPELRVSYTPATLVGIDLDREAEDEAPAYGRGGIALNSDDEFDEPAAGEDLTKSAAKKQFDPLQPDVVWVPEAIARLGIPQAVQDWEEKLQAKKTRSRTPKRRAAKQSDMPAGALDKYVTTASGPTQHALLPPSPGRVGLPSPHTPGKPANQTRLSFTVGTSKPSPASPAVRSKPPRKPKQVAAVPRSSEKTNPWTLAGSQVRPRVTKPAASAKPPACASLPIVIPSSPVGGPPSPAPRATLKRSLAAPAKSASREEHSSGLPDVRKQSSLKGDAPRARVFTLTERPKVRLEKEPTARTQTSAKGPAKATWESASADPSYSQDETKAGSPQIVELSSDEEEEEENRAPPSCAAALVQSRHVGDDDASALASKSESLMKCEMTKIYVSRLSDEGFFSEVEVTREDAVRLAKSQTENGGRKRIWRQSEIKIVDLTGEA